MSRKKKIKDKTKRTSRTSLMLLFVFALLLFMLLSIEIFVCFLIVLQAFGINISGGLSLIATLLFSSLVLATALAFALSRPALHPINSFVNAINSLAEGDFSKRLNPSRPWRNIPFISEIVSSYNTTAEELSKTELLRSDFIDNFSHEFKTPISSIQGFASLLEKGNLDKETEKEYLKIISSESKRLSQMATNVLRMTKIENQEILTDRTTFNLSEQIRECVLMLESRWSEKNITLDIDFEEWMIYGSEELLKEVWLNILDNAIKFSPSFGKIWVKIDHVYNTLKIRIGNSGSKIDDKDKELIFKKFYQCDTSHSTKGNGLGLTIVKKVVSLHSGKIKVYSGDYGTEFEITLPYNG